MSRVVLHVAETLKGGIASYLDELIPHQVATYGSHNIVLLVPEDQISEISKSNGVTILTFPGRGGRGMHIISIILALLRYIPHLNPNLIHVHSTFAGLATRLFSALFSLPCKIIYCAHGWAFDRDISSSNKWILRSIEVFLSRWCSLIICISRHDFHSAIAAKIPPEKLICISNAISQRFEIGDAPIWPVDCKRFIFVGRLDRQKGADLFIESLKQLKEPAFAYLVGAKVIDSFDLKGLPDNVKATGWLSRAQIQAYLASADVVVVPSRWEGFGLVALEAMRAGKPVIASRTGGLMELVEDRVTGMLIPPNSLLCLLEALRTACRENWSTWGSAGRQRFLNHYTSDRLNASLDDTYKNLFSQNMAVNFTPYASS